MTHLPDERRASTRCDVVKNRSSIQFEVPEGRRRIGATLINISRNGALVLAEKPMVRAAPLSIRIDSPVRTDWVDARVVRFNSNREIGLHFPQGCPDDLLLAATVGIDLAFLVRNEPNGTTAFD
jgi:PilZ domain